MKLEWPAKYVYIRSFKYDSQLEVWVKNDAKDKYKLFKTYKVCALAGTLGPKRLEGDYQVPEGFYHINEFNPNSTYHLSLGLNYPNASDRFYSDSLQPGGDIYIHGSCVTEGCIPVTDQFIEELYLITSYAKNEGQDFIPVHIYPVRFNNKKSAEYMDRYLTTFSEYKPFVNNLKAAFYYFEKYKELPVIMIDSKGKYAYDFLPEDVIPGQLVAQQKPRASRQQANNKVLAESEIMKVVEKQPTFPGGYDALNGYLAQCSKDLSVYLDDNISRAYLQVEYVVDADGQVIMPKIVKGGDAELQTAVLNKLDQMPVWTPASIHKKPVAFRIRQNIVIEK
jgi:murein L,D-transpeptidase YafK